MRKGTETEKIDYDEAIFFTVIEPAPPPECAVSGGYRSGAVGSSPEGLSSRPTVARAVARNVY